LPILPRFIPGLELSRRFYFEAVRPILEARFPALPHAAARIGWGSEVLGFDTEMSTDHNWGPIVQLFLRESDAGLAGELREAMRRELPQAFAGFPVFFALADTEQAPDHWVSATTVRAFVDESLGFDIESSLDPADWLTFPTQKLRAMTAGAVLHDGVGELTELRERLAFYPRDVWLYLLAAGWERIGQEEHLMPRAGYAGDELGSALLGSRLVRDVMRLCFLMERQYAPYPKWFGTAFARLACGSDLTPSLWAAQRAPTWQEREAALGRAFEYLAGMHNRLGIAPELPATVAGFHGRPFKVINGSEIAATIRGTIFDPTVKRIAERGLIGGIDLASDNTDLLEGAHWRVRLRRLYE
jgi:hypothetical protein